MIFHNRVVDFVKSPKNVCSRMFSHSLGPKENCYILHHIVKLQPAWTNMRYQFFLNFFHLVKSVGPYEWENTQEQTFFGLLTKSTALENYMRYFQGCKNSIISGEATKKKIRHFCTFLPFRSQ